MKVISRSLENGQPIAERNAFAVISETDHIALSDNLNPHLSWSDFPQETKSFAIICHDPDVPSVADDVNQEGKEIPKTLPRVNFYHWLLWNIPHTVTEIEEGSQSQAVTLKGKEGPEAPQGFSHGKNDYTSFMAGDEAMAGEYYGYDGPCPPWNDTIIHHYTFTVYALDCERLEVKGEMSGEDLLKAMEGHILAQASITGTYTLNPNL